MPSSPCTDCQGFGVCQDNGLCRCFPARAIHEFNGTRYTDQCTDSVLDDNAYQVMIFRVVNCVLSFILLALISWRIFLEIRVKLLRPEDTQTVVKKMVKFQLVILWFICLITFLTNALDYWGLYGILPSEAYYFFYYVTDYLFIVVFCGILLHWAEIYRTTMKTFRTREMIRKVNSNYNTELTLDDIMTSITFLQKYKIFFIVVAGFSFAIVIVLRLVCSRHLRDAHAFMIMNNFFPAYYASVWVCFGVGFGLYGYRLIRIMPERMALEVRGMMIKILVVLLLCLTDAIQIITINQVIKVLAESILIRNYISLFLRLAVVSIILEINMPITKFRHWFSPSLLWTSSKSSNTGKSNSDEAKTQIDVNLSTIKTHEQNGNSS